MILYIVRHGETEWNQKRKLQGQTDIPLNEKGMKLAEITGKGMADIPFDLAITSPLIRTIQTTQLILGDRQVPIVEDKRIQEISFGDWEGESVLGDSRVLPADFWDVFYKHPLEFKRPPHGENFLDVIMRTRDFYQEISNKPEYQDSTILITSHGCASRCLLTNFFRDQEDIWRGCVPPNCAVTTVKVRDGVGEILELDKIFYEK